MTSVSSFGRWVKERRQALDLTQESLAEQAGCSVDTIRKIESGTRRPSRQIAELLAACLGVAPEHRASFTQWARGIETEAPPTTTGPTPAAASAPTAGQGTAAARSAAPPPAHLPLALTSLIGRETETAHARALLWRVGVRLVTLTGPGGTGKTRLALELAANLRADFADGVYFVSLATVRDPALVPGAIAGVLGLKEVAGEPVLATLLATLRERALMLVLDNFEHLTAAAPFVTALLEAAPRLKVLVTSRARLQLRGEKQFPVPPLALPDLEAGLAAEQLAQFPAIALFLERAQDANPTFALSPENVAAAAAICLRLDGLPLAIELAAARSRSLTPRALLAQLSGATPAPAMHLLAGGYRDLPARQQTLRNTIAWSYDLLTPPQQTLFRRLAVFVGGCTEEAAAAVCADSPSQHADLNMDLEALLDGNLLRLEPGVADEPRYTMLETIHEFAGERLAESGELDALQRRHALYFLDLAEANRAELRGRNQATWLARWDQEHANVRALLAWAHAHGESELMLRTGQALWRFWYGHHTSEGRRWLETALAVTADTPVPPVLRAGVLSALGTLARLQADFPQGAAYLRESLALYRQSGDREGTANALNNLANLVHHQGDYAQARVLNEESVSIFRELGDSEAVADTLSNLGIVVQDQGEYDYARALHEESLAGRRARGDKWGVAVSLHNLSDVAQHQGDYTRARVLQEEGLVLFQEVGDQVGTAVGLNNLGNLALRAGDLASAQAFQAQGIALFRQLGDKRGLIWCLDSLAGIAVAAGHWAAAIRLLAAAAAAREAIGSPANPFEQVAYDEHLAAARAQLPPADADAAWAAGQALTLDQALATATAPPISNATLTLL